MGFGRDTGGSSGGGSGQNNTISSDGGGLDITATISKVGVDLRVRSLAGTLPLSVAQVADLITITIAGLVNADIASGANIALSKLEPIVNQFDFSRRTTYSNNALFFANPYAGGEIMTESLANVAIERDLTIVRAKHQTYNNTKDATTVMGFRDDGVTVANVSILGGVTAWTDTGVISVSVASGSLINFIVDTTSSISGACSVTAYCEYTDD